MSPQQAILEFKDQMQKETDTLRCIAGYVGNNEQYAAETAIASAVERIENNIERFSNLMEV